MLMKNPLLIAALWVMMAPLGVAQPAKIGAHCEAAKDDKLCAKLADTSTRVVEIPADEELTLSNWKIPLGKRITGPGSIFLNAFAEAGLVIDPTQRVIHFKIGGESTQSLNSMRTATIIEGVFFGRVNPCHKTGACAGFAGDTFDLAQACYVQVQPGGGSYYIEGAKEWRSYDAPGHVMIRDNEFRDISGKRVAICGGTSRYTQKDYERHSTPAAIRRQGAPGFGLIISDNSFMGFNRHLTLDQLEHVTVQGNLFMQSTGSSIVLRSDVGRVLVDGNQFFDIGNPKSSGASADAIDSHWSGDQLTISNNVIRRVAVFGLDIKNMAFSDQVPMRSGSVPSWPAGYIDYHAGRSGSRGVIITGNNISETQQSAIRIAGASAKGSTDASPVLLGHPNHSILITQNVVHEANTRCDNNAGIQVSLGAVRYVNIADNAVTNTCGHGIEVNSVSSADQGIPSEQLGIERLHRVLGVRVHGNMVINNGRRCMLAEPGPEIPLETPFEYFLAHDAYVTKLKDEIGDPSLPAYELTPLFEEAICTRFRAQRKLKRFPASFGITSQGVHGLDVSNNIVGNDVDLYHPWFPSGLVRTYSDLAIRVIPPNHTTNANLSVSSIGPVKRELAPDERAALNAIKDNTVFCGMQADPRLSVSQNILFVDGVVDASNRTITTHVCPSRLQ